MQQRGHRADSTVFVKIDLLLRFDMSENQKRFLSVNETAAYLNISPRTIYNKTGRKAKEKFPVRPKRVGRCVRFDIKDIEKYIDSL